MSCFKSRWKAEEVGRRNEKRQLTFRVQTRASTNYRFTTAGSLTLIKRFVLLRAKFGQGSGKTESQATVASSTALPTPAKKGRNKCRAAKGEKSRVAQPHWKIKCPILVEPTSHRAQSAGSDGRRKRRLMSTCLFFMSLHFVASNKVLITWTLRTRLFSVSLFTFRDAFSTVRLPGRLQAR